MDDLDCKRKIEEKARMGITNEKFASTSAYNFQCKDKMLLK